MTLTLLIHCPDRAGISSAATRFLHTADDFIAQGRDLEIIVLARPVQLHLKRKTLVYNNKTVIFA